MTMSLIQFVFEHGLTVAGFLLALALVTHVLRDQRRSSGALAWVMAIVLIPYVAVPLYVVVGGRKLPRRVRRKNELYHRDWETPQIAPHHRAEEVLLAAGMPPARSGNDARIVYSGETAYHELIAMLESAEHSIHAMTFILGREEVGRSIIDVLTRKAREGVQVRLILDGLGCIRTSGRYVARLREAGGEVERFLPVLPLRRKWSANLRNHRKIVVVDGETAMVGGMNFSKDFMGPVPYAKRFKDCAVFLRGPAVQDIDNIFISDWEYVSEQELRVAPKRPEATGNSLLQVVGSGPDVPEDTLHDMFMAAAMDAKERIWIVTPYFVPDAAILNVLALQARAGRDVRIVVPATSNHRIPDLARGPALRRLAQAGAEVLLYEPGMVHGKVLLFDDRLAVTGSPNLDMRSMYVNFEIALLHYSADEIEQTAGWVRGLAAQSRPLDPRAPHLLREWMEGACFLASPLL